MSQICRENVFAILYDFLLVNNTLMFGKKQEAGNTDLDGDISFGDLPHIEANCGNHVFAEMAWLKGDVDKLGR